MNLIAISGIMQEKYKEYTKGKDITSVCLTVRMFLSYHSLQATIFSKKVMNLFWGIFKWLDGKFEPFTDV